MTTFRMQTALQDRSGLARDQYVSTLHVDSTDFITGVRGAEWQVATNQFWDSLTSYLSSAVAQNGHTFKVYDQSLPLDSPPVHSGTFNLGNAPSASPLPNEVACCLSYKGAPHPGWQKQSTRGRIYIGPLGTSDAVVAANTSRPADAFLNGVLAAGVALSTSINTALSQMVIYSRVHNATTVITEFSVDDEWDTQRSRGKRATKRIVLPAGT